MHEKKMLFQKWLLSEYSFFFFRPHARKLQHDKRILTQKNLALEVATIYVLTKTITDKRKNEIQYYFFLRVETKSKPLFCQLSIALRHFPKCNIFL